MFRTYAARTNVVGDIPVTSGDAGAVRLDVGTYIISITILRASGVGLPYTAFHVETDEVTTITARETAFNAFNMTAVYTVQTSVLCLFSAYFVISSAVSWNGRFTVTRYQ